MDINLLVDEILAQVLKQMTNAKPDDNTVNRKDKILVLSEQHSVVCNELLEESKLESHYEIDHVLDSEYNCKLDDYEAIVIYNLSIDALCKLANGICDTPFISIASRAILMGKRIFVTTEGMELFTYKKSAPIAYYSMMNEKVTLLTNSGVTFCKNNELLEQLISNEIKHTDKTCEHVKQNEIRQDETISHDIKSFRINKKVITEGDVIKLSAEGVKKIIVNSNAILTDLAKEYMHNKRIELIKDSLTTGKFGKGL